MADTDTEEYYSVGWWKDDAGNIHQGSVESAGFKKAKDKGPLGSEPETEPAVDAPKDGDEAAAAAKAAELAAADAAKAAETKAAAEKAAAEKAAQSPRQGSK